MGHYFRTYLVATDVGESIAFYRDVLGLPVVEGAAGRAKLGDEGCGIVVEEDLDADELAAYGLEQPGASRGDGVILDIEVDDVGAVHERALASDSEVLAAPRAVDWGREITLIADPDGYVVEASRPLGDDDRADRPD